MQKLHWATIGSIIGALACFILGSVIGGGIFVALAIWVEVNGALKMARKVKAHVHNRKQEAEQHE